MKKWKKKKKKKRKKKKKKKKKTTVKNDLNDENLKIFQFRWILHCNQK